MNKIAITGAGKRVGAFFAKTLLEVGYKIVAHYRSDAKELEEWLQLDENRRFINRVEFIKEDFLKSTATLKKVLKDDREITVLINSASVFESAPITDIDSFRRQAEINSFIPLELASEFSQNSSAELIINMVDGNIERVNSKFQAYRTSKLLLKELTRQLAVDLGDKIRVNGIAPGTVLPPERGADKSYKDAIKVSPLKREASLDSLAKTLLFLIENKDITGEIINVDCGVHCL